MKLNQNSLFAVLLRSPWWMSLGLAAGVFFVARLFVPPFYAAFVPLPFLVIAGVVIWRQLQRPSARKVAARLDALRALPREEFAAALEQGFRRQGYGVTRIGNDLQLTKSGRVSLVDCKRWKATRTGVEPLREFHAAGQKSEAGELIYVAVGEVTDNARAFAREKNIRLIGDAELAELAG
ncbi:MAG TPA: restriction endonuclease [Burkholderiales bacterium]